LARLGEALEQDESQSDESPKGVFGHSQGYLRALWVPAVKKP
jgi:malonyl CoA-acyl carrier protein transacylase